MFKKAGLRLIRTKYRDWEMRYKQYSRKKRKLKKERKSLTRGLLRLVEKLDTTLDSLEKKYEFQDKETYEKQRKIIKNVLSQQKQIFLQKYYPKDHPKDYPKDRIISLFKPYLRPIVRCKENKKVEFGAKVNKIQIDGINFIQFLSFDPFNEGTHFQSSIDQAQHLTGIKIMQVGTDAIYATNENRSFAAAEEIKTNFVRKGKAGKNEEERKQIAKSLRKERASRLEGSFGTEKEYYSLKKIKARTQKTEILWIFFGIHTANAVKIGHRMSGALFTQHAD